MMDNRQKKYYILSTPNYVMKNFIFLFCFLLAGCEGPISNVRPFPERIDVKKLQSENKFAIRNVKDARGVHVKSMGTVHVGLINISTTFSSDKTISALMKELFDSTLCLAGVRAESLATANYLVDLKIKEFKFYETIGFTSEVGTAEMKLDATFVDPVNNKPVMKTEIYEKKQTGNNLDATSKAPALMGEIMKAGAEKFINEGVAKFNVSEREISLLPEDSIIPDSASDTPETTGIVNDPNIKIEYSALKDGEMVEFGGIVESDVGLEDIRLEGPGTSISLPYKYSSRNSCCFTGSGKTKLSYVSYARMPLDSFENGEMRFALKTSTGKEINTVVRFSKPPFIYPAIFSSGFGGGMCRIYDYPGAEGLVEGNFCRWSSFEGSLDITARNFGLYADGRWGWSLLKVENPDTSKRYGLTLGDFETTVSAKYRIKFVEMFLGWAYDMRHTDYKFRTSKDSVFTLYDESVQENGFNSGIGFRTPAGLGGYIKYNSCVDGYVYAGLFWQGGIKPLRIALDCGTGEKTKYLRLILLFSYRPDAKYFSPRDAYGSMQMENALLKSLILGTALYIGINGFTNYIIPEAWP